MKYGHAVLGESLELYREAVEWGRDQKAQMDKNERARAVIWDSLAPMLAEKHKMPAGRKMDK